MARQGRAADGEFVNASLTGNPLPQYAALLKQGVCKVNWKLHLALPLCLAMTTGVRPAVAGIIETVYYDFTFEMASGGIAFYFPRDPFWSVEELEASEAYTPLFGFGFFHYGSDVLNLQGQTLSLGNLLWSMSPPAPIELAWQSFAADDSFWSLTGNVTFGPGNTIADWDVETSDEWQAENRGYLSNPFYVTEGWGYFSLLDDQNPYIGQEIYGFNDSDHYGLIFWTSPGRWTTSIQRHCYAGEDESEVPCPEAPLAPVPLPPALLLLASGLAGLGLVRRRGRRPAA